MTSSFSSKLRNTANDPQFISTMSNSSELRSRASDLLFDPQMLEHNKAIYNNVNSIRYQSTYNEISPKNK